MTSERERLIFRNKQLICDPTKGDCFRACMTSILGIPNSSDLPDSSEGWAGKWYSFLYQMGLSMQYDEVKVWREGFWIASVPSKNFEKCTHSIIMLGQEVYFDPSPKEGYTVGDNLLSKNIVLGGWWLEVNNIHRLLNADRRRCFEAAALIVERHKALSFAPAYAYEAMAKNIRCERLQNEALAKCEERLERTSNNHAIQC